MNEKEENVENKNTPPKKRLKNKKYRVVQVSRRKFLILVAILLLKIGFKKSKVKITRQDIQHVIATSLSSGKHD